MTWAEVADRLAAARTYWLGTTTGSGAPHAAPVWGAVTGGTLYLYSERSTVKSRNLAVDLLDVAVEIPMIGSGASLNVAVAGSLVLYRLAGFL